MKPQRVGLIRDALIWAALLAAISVSIAAAAQSPLLAWRDPIYQLGGFAGIVAMTVMLVQPLLAAGFLPGCPAPRGRRVHRYLGLFLLLAVVIHVIALWITSPPDVVDALLLVSPTPFSIWGVLSMWALLAAAPLALYRKRLRLRFWRLGHTTLVCLAVAGTVAHVLLIQGTMEATSKFVLSGLVLVALGKAVVDLRAWAILKRRGP